MLQKLKICLSISTLLSITAHAQSNKQDDFKQPTLSITPIFSQVLVTSIPKGFEMVFANVSSSTGYIHELVPKGENINQWTQMLTVTGAKNIALTPQLTPQKVLAFFGSGFQNSCPNSFNAHSFPARQINGYDSASAIISCGLSKATQGQTSETALITVIKGSNDYYTIQWAERDQPSSNPITIDLTKWTSRLEQQVKPIKLCTATAGEQAPYPSCMNSIKQTN